MDAGWPAEIGHGQQWHFHAQIDAVVTLAGFHSLNYGMFDLAHGCARRQMNAFVELPEKEFAAADRGFTAVKHQREVGTGYFDAVTQAIQQGQSSTTTLTGSAEEARVKQVSATQGRPSAGFPGEPCAHARGVSTPIDTARQ
jgi:hypothetical protein